MSGDCLLSQVRDLFHCDNNARTDAFFIPKFNHGAAGLNSFNGNGLIGLAHPRHRLSLF